MVMHEKISSLLEFLGLRLTKQQMEMKLFVQKTWKSVKVSRKGGLRIDKEEILDSEGYKLACEKARQIVKD